MTALTPSPELSAIRHHFCGNLVKATAWSCNSLSTPTFTYPPAHYLFRSCRLDACDPIIRLHDCVHF